MTRTTIFLASLLFTQPAFTHEHSQGHFVGKDEQRTVDGVSRPGRILVSTFDSDEFVVIDAVSRAAFKTPLHIHHEHHEAVFVLSGKSIVTIGEATRTLTEGDFVFMPKGNQHRLEIVEPGRAIVVASHGYDEASSELFRLFSEGVPAKEIYEQLDGLEYVSE